MASYSYRAQGARSLQIAVQLLADRHDRDEAILAVQDRLKALINSREVAELLLRERTEPVD